jgi:hypothetical protein
MRSPYFCYSNLKRPLWSLERRWVDNGEMDIIEIVHEGVAASVV